MCAKQLLVVVLFIGLSWMTTADSSGIVDYLERCFVPLDAGIPGMRVPHDHRGMEGPHHVWLNNSNCHSWRADLGEKDFRTIQLTLVAPALLSNQDLTKIERQSEASLAADMTPAQTAAPSTAPTTASPSNMSAEATSSTTGGDSESSATGSTDNMDNTDGAMTGDSMQPDQPDSSSSGDNSDGSEEQIDMDQNLDEKGEGESEGEGRHGRHHWHRHHRKRRSFFFPNMFDDDREKGSHHVPKPSPPPSKQGQHDEPDWNSALYAQFKSKSLNHKQRVASYRHDQRRGKQLDSTLWPAATIDFTFATSTGTHTTPNGATLTTTPVDVAQQAKAVEAMMDWEDATCLSFNYVLESSGSKPGLLLISGARSESQRECGAAGDGFPGNGQSRVLYLAGGTVDDVTIENALHDEVMSHDNGNTPTTESSETVDPLAAGCPRGVILHALGHVAGLQHTAQRQDRDSYVTLSSEIDSQTFGAEYRKPAAAPVTEVAIPGELVSDAPASEVAQARATNFYESVMLYAADEFMQPLIDMSLRSEEFVSQVSNNMGQRTRIGLLDRAGVNTAYHCQPLNVLTDSGASDLAGYFHADQTVLQTLRRVHRWMLRQPTLKQVAFDQIRLYRDSVSDANELTVLTDVISTALGSDVNPTFAFSLLTDTVQVFLSSSKSVRLHVDFGWTVERTRANLAAYYDIDVVALKVGSENLVDSDTLSAAGVTSSTQLFIVTKADVASNSPQPRVDTASSTGNDSEILDSTASDSTDTTTGDSSQTTDSTDSTGSTDSTNR